MSETASLLSVSRDSVVEEKVFQRATRGGHLKIQLYLWLFLSSALVASLVGNILQFHVYGQTVNDSNSCKLSLCTKENISNKYRKLIRFFSWPDTRCQNRLWC